MSVKNTFWGLGRPNQFLGDLAKDIEKHIKENKTSDLEYKKL